MLGATIDPQLDPAEEPNPHGASRILEILLVLWWWEKLDQPVCVNSARTESFLGRPAARSSTPPGNVERLSRVVLKEVCFASTLPKQFSSVKMPSSETLSCSLVDHVPGLAGSSLKCSRTALSAA